MGRSKLTSSIIFPRIQRTPNYNRWLGGIIAQGKANKQQFIKVDKAFIDGEWERQARARWSNDKKLLEMSLEQVRSWLPKSSQRIELRPAAGMLGECSYPVSGAPGEGNCGPQWQCCF